MDNEPVLVWEIEHSMFKYLIDNGVYPLDGVVAGQAIQFYLKDKDGCYIGTKTKTCDINQTDSPPSH